MKVNELEQTLEELQATLRSFTESKPRPVGTLRRQLRDLNPYINHFASQLRIHLVTSGWGGAILDIFGRLLDETLPDEQVSSYVIEANAILSHILNHIQATYRAKNDEIALPDPNEDVDKLTRRVEELEKYRRYIKAAITALGILGISVGGVLTWLRSLQTDANAISDKLTKAEQNVTTLFNDGKKTFDKQVQDSIDAAKKEIDDHKQLYLPVGTIVAFSGPIDNEHPLPHGWVLCDGRTIDLRKAEDKKYEKLRDAIGKTWGSGGSSGKDTFNLPDLRGIFLRGANNDQLKQELIDPDDSHDNSRRKSFGSFIGDLLLGGNRRGVGSYQLDATAAPIDDMKTLIGPHYHDLYYFIGVPGDGPTPNGAILLQSANPPAQGKVFAAPGGRTGSEVGGSHVHTIKRSADAGGDKETRPKNAAVNWIIKY